MTEQYKPHLDPFLTLGLTGLDIHLTEEVGTETISRPLWQHALRKLLLPFHIEGLDILPGEEKELWVNPQETLDTLGEFKPEYLTELGEFCVRLKRLNKNPESLYNRYRMTLVRPIPIPVEEADSEGRVSRIRESIVTYFNFETLPDGINQIAPTKTTPQINAMILAAIISIRHFIDGSHSSS